MQTQCVASSRIDLGSNLPLAHAVHIARVTDERLNAGLPAFLHRGPTGLNSGLMGAQVTASALLTEMRCLTPASVHSISTNGVTQDVVSMGAIAAHESSPDRRSAAWARD